MFYLRLKSPKPPNPKPGPCSGRQYSIMGLFRWERSKFRIPYKGDPHNTDPTLNT